MSGLYEIINDTSKFLKIPSDPTTSNFWCQQFIMIGLTCDIVLSESNI